MSAFIRLALAATVFASALSFDIKLSRAADQDQVKFTIDKWRKPGSNNIGTADITVDNGNDFAIKDLKIACHYMAKTGKKIETEQTVAVTVKAKSQKTFKKTKFPFIDVTAADGKCELVSVQKA
jgi:hypothetical protein